MPPEPEKEIVIDGDRLIAFINGVKHLGKILEELNVMEVKEAFLRGKQLGSIEAIAEIDRTWSKTMEEIGGMMRQNVLAIEANKKELHMILALMKSTTSVLCGTETKSAIANGQALVAVLDRLEHHKNNGTFKILESLQQPT